MNDDHFVSVNEIETPTKEELLARNNNDEISPHQLDWFNDTMSIKSPKYDYNDLGLYYYMFINLYNRIVVTHLYLTINESFYNLTLSFFK